MLAMTHEALSFIPSTVEQRKHRQLPLVSTQNWSETLPHPDATFISCPGLWVYIVEWSSTCIACMCSWIQSPAQLSVVVLACYPALGIQAGGFKVNVGWRGGEMFKSTGLFLEDPGLNPSTHSGIHNCL